MKPLSLLLLATSLATPALAQDAITVTGSRLPAANPTTPSVTLLTPDQILPYDLSSVADLIRLTPGASVSVSGPAGSQTQVRLRGAEANHTLVFVDGIEANDPGSSNEFRWEYLPAANVERVEIRRGASSALWGSEALAGVVAVTTREPTIDPAFGAQASYGSFDTHEGSAFLTGGSETAQFAATGSYVESEGIDTFSGGPDERDGFNSLALTAKARLAPSPIGSLEIAARYGESETEFDGNDPATFQRADTPDRSQNQQLGVRGTARLALSDEKWRHDVTASYLGTDNENFRGGTALNRVDASSLRLSYQTGYRFAAASAQHELIAAAEYREQQYRTADNNFFGATDQDRSRQRRALVAEYRLAADRLSLNASVRFDDNDRFENATTWRVGGSLALNDRLSLHANAGEAFAAPTFTEQFGFFPNSFAGNPDLQPERSFAWDVGAAYDLGPVAISAVYFQANLRDEIVSTFDSTTFLAGVDNAAEKSERRGIELASDATLGPLSLRAQYTFIDAEEVAAATGLTVREVRRPRHSAGLAGALDLGRADIGLTLAYVGERRDLDFDVFPARNVNLGAYVLGTLAAEVEVTRGIAVTGRIENLFDANHQDVFGFQTQGIGAHIGLRLKAGS
ncbi:MAG: TonB-dependent receptor [Pacificimonas sp.]|jgi:vitamin B12 transporter|nr:TonB-dependent receptor [Pacificimonas sp.]